MIHSSFGVIAQKLGDNLYSIICGGQRFEASYYRTDVFDDLEAGDTVFIEQLPDSMLWMITCQAFGNPGASGSPGWFEVDHADLGKIDGSGRIAP